jgi:protein-L-isoaspartate(D-aspartate) O-methyltransferase
MTERLRGFYARLVTATGGAQQPDLVEAFGSVDRVVHLGPGPWKIATTAGYVETPDDDAAFIYQDVPVALAAERNINNGQRSLHARCLGAINPLPGETALHIGAGTGYYTAILARLVGPSGRVLAYEREADLAGKAAGLLAGWPHVSVHPASACEVPIPACDVIYVSAGASYPPATWLDALKPGGRLVFPLTTDSMMGVLMLITRTGERGFGARVISGAMFIPCAGARDEAASQALLAALTRGGHGAVRSLQRQSKPDETSWLAGDGWWFSTRAP